MDTMVYASGRSLKMVQLVTCLGLTPNPNQKATLNFERELGVMHVVVDGLQGFKNSVPTVWAHTSDELSILRLHGRNDATWDQKGLSAASDQFNYDYSDEELSGLTPAIIEMAKKVKVVQVVFNNMED